jgi:beta-xylosidase
MRFHHDRFWIFLPTPHEGIYVTHAEEPDGQWSKPHLVQAGRGLIDPCQLWDDDGSAYLVHAFAGSRAGIKNRLRVCSMAADATRLLDEGRIVFHEPERHPTLEGPKFLKRNGWYYILAPAGVVTEGWQVALRSRHIFGPYEDRVALEQGSTMVHGPHQGALVDAPDDRW